MHNYTSFLLQKQGISSKNKDFFRKRFRCFRRGDGRLVLFSDASVSHHRNKRPIVFCTYLTNSFLALRPCWTNPPKCQPPLFRPADSVHNTRTFVFVRAGWTAAEVIGNIFHEYSVYFSAFFQYFHFTGPFWSNDSARRIHKRGQKSRRSRGSGGRVCQKSLAEFAARRRQIKCNPFFAAACTSQKTLLSLQVWNLFAFSEQIMRAADCKPFVKKGPRPFLTS